MLLSPLLRNARQREYIVDVFQVVKALRVQKPGAVPTVVSV